MPADGSNSCPVPDIAKWANSRQRASLWLGTNREPPYALIACQMLAVGEGHMATQEEIDANLEDALKGLWQAATACERLAALRIEDGEDPSWYAIRASVYRSDADKLSPPNPSYPFQEGSNVIPFVPRRTG